MPDVNRRLSVLADSEPFAPDCRFRLSGTLRTGLFPSLFLLECRNLSDADVFRLRNTKELSVLREDSCLAFGQVSDVPVFMPVPFEVNPGDPCLVIFADIDIDAWFESGEPQEPKSARKHALSDGFAFVGWKMGNGE